MKQKFTVTGMTCSACSAHVDKAVRKLDGVCEVNVNLLGGSMTVDWDGALTPDQIVSAVRGTARPCRPQGRKAWRLSRRRTPWRTI